MFHLMCPPTYFKVPYIINPWMDPNVPVDFHLARRQWDNLMLILQELGEKVLVMDPQPGLHDMTFSGDGGLVVGNVFFPSNFRTKERAPEAPHFAEWFGRRGYQLCRIPEDICFEGLGDLLPYQDVVVFGHGIRSDSRALQYIVDSVPTLNVLLELRIVDERYFHLALAFSFIDRDTILYYPKAFDDESNIKIMNCFKNPIAVDDLDAGGHFVCNNLVFRDTVILDNCSAGLEEKLSDLGYSVKRCPMSEFKKSGASVRCLVLSF